MRLPSYHKIFEVLWTAEFRALQFEDVCISKGKVDYKIIFIRSYVFHLNYLAIRIVFVVHEDISKLFRSLEGLIIIR